MKHKIGSLFDGSGGFPLAASMCGIEPTWAAEIEPYPIAVTRSRFPNMKHLGSVTDVKGNEVEPVDVITFGSPCQDLSVAGKRAGLKHTENGDEETTRSGLFMEAIRIIKEMREATNGAYPRFAVWENVPGAFSSNKGEDFRIVLEEFVKVVEPTAVMPPVPKGGWAYADSYCGDGWSLAYRVLDAQHFGVPQRRRRLFLTLDLTGNRARAIQFERDGVRGHFETFRTAWEAPAGDAVCGIETADCERCGVIAAGFKAGQGAQARSIGWEEEKCPTLAAEAGGNSVPSICTKTQYLFENHSQDSRYRGPLEVCPMLPAQLGTGGNNQPFVVQEGVIPIHDQATRFSGKHGDKYDGKGNGLGVGEPDAPMNTLTSGDRHAVCYALSIGNGQLNQISMSEVCNTLDCMHDKQAVIVFDKEVYQSGEKATGGHYIAEDGPAPTLRTTGHPPGVCHGVDCRNLTEHAELYPTLQAKPNGGQSLNYSGAVRIEYLVRRLTPTECARLQGFPDDWGHPDQKEDFTDEEYEFWLDVRNTHAAINGKTVKDYTKPQMVKWYNKLHTDSAEYKLWGNGIALPCALYVLEGIAEELKED